MKELEYITIAKKWIGRVEAFAGTLEELSELHGVESLINIPDEEDIRASDEGEAIWPEGAKAGDICAWFGDDFQKVESIESARKALIEREIETDAVVSFFGTIEELKAEIANPATPETYRVILRSGLEKVEPSLA